MTFLSPQYKVHFSTGWEQKLSDISSFDEFVPSEKDSKPSHKQGKVEARQGKGAVLEVYTCMAS